MFPSAPSRPFFFHLLQIKYLVYTHDNIKQQENLSGLNSKEWFGFFLGSFALFFFPPINSGKSSSQKV